MSVSVMPSLGLYEPSLNEIMDVVLAQEEQQHRSASQSPSSAEWELLDGRSRSNSNASEIHVGHNEPNESSRPEGEELPASTQPADEQVVVPEPSPVSTEEAKVTKKTTPTVTQPTEPKIKNQPRARQQVFVRDISHAINTEFGETKDAFVLLLDVAGVKKEDIEMQVDEQRVLHITGERKQPAMEGLRFHNRQAYARYGRFHLMFGLESLKDVRLDGISARSQSGQLIVTIPKDLRVKQAVRINVA